MNRFYKILVATILTIMVLPLGQKAYAWTPNEKYALWVRTFAVDKTWNFTTAEGSQQGNPNNGATLVDHPGTIAWCFMVWDEHKNDGDDYNMDHCKMYICTEGHKYTDSYRRICDIDIDNSDDNNYLPCSITDYNDCKTWCVQARWYNYADGAWFLYMVTEYSDGLRKVMESWNDYLCINFRTRWDDGHWNDYSKYSQVLDKADRTFMKLDAPVVSNAEWMVHDGKTAVKYTNKMSSACQLNIVESCNKTKVAKDYDWSDANSGSSDSYLYPFDINTKPSYTDMNKQPITYTLQARKKYTMSQSYYQHHGTSSSCPKDHYIYSDKTTFSPPKFAQPVPMDIIDNGNGTVKLSWKIDNTEGDQSDFVIERSYDENFSQIVKTDKVAFRSNTTQYTYIDSYDDRNKGKKTFYYRLHREHAERKDLHTIKTKIVNTDYISIAEMDATAIAGGKVSLKWKYNDGIWDNSTMSLQLTCDGDLLTTFNNTDNESYTTTEPLITCTPLTFAVKIMVNGTEQSSRQSVVTLPADKIGIILDMKPSCGYFNDHVTVKWEIDAENNNFNYFQILRTEYGADDATTESLGTVNAVVGITEYSFEDRTCIPGTYYLYSVQGYSECDGNIQTQASKSDVGFAQPFGVISGQITYEGNQGVKNVAVHAIGDDTRRGYSLYFKTDRNPSLSIPVDMLKQMIAKDAGTIEMFVKREGEDVFHHIATSYQESTYTTYLDGVPQSGTSRPTWFPIAGNQWPIAVYNDAGTKVNGFIDEIRIWNISRDSADIVKTMNCYLNGNENGLTGYYRCDDNVPNHLFDISRKGNNYNSHHLTMSNITFDESNIPTTEQLSLRSYTDDNGNYLITSIPYSVNGSLYNVVPTLGVHEFSPMSRPLFFNSDATTHNSIDFTDVSSFLVSGQVFYEGTDYPVEGCNFYVDGNICAANNEMIQSEADGTFTISVPIGEHYIEVRKSDHTFLYGGRYPEDKEGVKTTFNFQQPVNNLTFYDNTLVTLTGRVAGGTDQEALPHGMQQGKANIGKAHIVISPETKEKYNLNTSELFVREWNTPDSCTVNSRAYTPAKSGSRGMRIAIDTDPITGEFSVLVPPIDMTVDSINIPSAPEVLFDLGAFEKMELSLVGDARRQTDTLLVNAADTQFFSYTAKLDAIYRVNPELIISDTQYDNGMMGIRNYLIPDPKSDTVYTVNIFEYDDNNKAWKYNFEVPFFLQGNTYVWHLRAFERYVNKDNATAVKCDSVPLRKSIVTLYNQLGLHQTFDCDTIIVSPSGDSIQYHVGDMLLETNQVQLDSLTGSAYYSFNAGDPLKTAPHRLGLTITFTDSEQTRDYDWDQNGKFQGVIIGSVSEGTNFVTEGPDHIDFVLRDPPGSGSYATLKAGTKRTTTKVTTHSGHWSEDLGNVFSFGMDVMFGVGVGFIEINSFKAVDNLTVSGEHRGHRDDVWTTTTTFTTTQDISTKSDQMHVGSSGDVFIGRSFNRTFGEATMVTLQRDTVGNYSVGTEPVINVGERFKTEFAFSQLEIEKTLIPDYIKLRNALLETVTSDEYANPRENKGKEERYITTLSENAPNFGDSATYKIVYPQDNDVNFIQDMVDYYNTQIRVWKNRLAENEKAKVGKWENEEGELVEKELLKNVSVNGGVRLTESTTTSSTSGRSISEYQGFNIHVYNEFGWICNTVGQKTYLNVNDGADFGETDDKTTTKDTSIIYTFDLNPYEQLSINIYDAGDGWSPVFSTVGGQTSCPYEGEEKTKYFEPGVHTLNVATQKMEDPLIRVEGSSAFSAIPVGGSATYNLQLSNQAIVLGIANMNLRLMDDSNPDGAELLIDGMPLTAEGVTYHFSGNNVLTKTLTLKQGRADVLEYSNIGIILSSNCTARSVADTCFISASFIAACSDISLSVDTRVVNAERDGMLPMTISGYDYNLPTLSGCRLQYKQPMETNWHLIQEFSKDEMKNGNVYYTWDMTALNDGDYEVRAVTVCDLNGQEVINESEVIPIVKDITAPEALGLPSPINGIYTVDNQIYVDFNKNIQTGRIISTCVDVNGVLNAHEQTHSVGLISNGQTSYTEAEFDLSSTDFSFETWINWSKGGTLLSHTTDGLKLSIQDDGHLRISIDSQQWVSQQTMPKDKWLYFLFNYKRQSEDNALASAYCAYDDQTINLFVDEAVANFERRGMLFIADETLTAKMHDAVFWNTSRDWTTALSERNKSKDAYIDGIVSYWPMDEGDGNIAHDVVRNRDLILNNSTMWWFNNENKALHIPANTEAVLDFSKFPYTFGNDYLFSFWFRTEATHETPFFRTSNGSLITHIDGRTFVMETKDGISRFDMGVQLNDGAWHHFAISTSHSFSPIILIDGETHNIATMDRQVFLSDAIVFSDKTATDAFEIDEVCSWKANCSASYISNLYRNQLKGNEPGLVSYFPMEETIVDQYGQNVTRLSLTDKQTTQPDWSSDMYLRDANGTVSAIETQTVPPIRELLPIEKVKHTYTSSDRRLVVNITEDARRIEGCTLNLTVQNIVDENGNYSAPINWSVYVNRNQLLWDETNLRVVKKSMTDTTFQVTILNNSGRTENWSINNIPEWLTFNEYNGVLSPLSKKTLEATISSSLAIGTHQSTIYLMGNEGINQPLYVSVKVNATQPDWKINPADYEHSMNMIAVAFIDNHLSDDSEDMIAAFVNDELAGVGHPKLFPIYNQYLVMMDIYANLNEKQLASINNGGKIPVTFKYWDASTGITYNRLKVQSNASDEPLQSIAFVPSQLVGQPNNPVRLTADKDIEQTLSLVSGWNWISFNVIPEDNSFTSILNDVLENISLIKSQTTFAQFDGTNHLIGSLEYEEPIRAYKLRMNKPCTITVSGQVSNPTYLGIPLAANGWSWIGYLPQTSMSVNAALANLNPSFGDIIKARSGFATWDGYSWIGSLTTMSPGNGYLYYNSNEKTATLYYPSSGTPGFFSPLKSFSISAFSPIEATKYQNNMTVTAVVMNGNQIVEDAEVGIFVGEECRSAAVSQDGYWFLTIPGETNVELTIKISIDGDIQTLKQVITYVDDAVLGSPSEPYIIQLEETTGIEDVQMRSENKGPRVFIEDGIVYIERDGKIYDLKGKFVKKSCGDMTPTISKHIRKHSK